MPEREIQTGIGPVGQLRIGRAIGETLAKSSSFDAAVENASRRFPAVGRDEAFFVVGFSEARGGLEVWGANGLMGRPFSRFPTGHFLCQPDMPIPPPFPRSERDVRRFAIQVLSLQRRVTWGGEEGFAPGTHAIGGTAEMATITRSSASVETILEWPDQLNERIDIRESVAA